VIPVTVKWIRKINSPVGFAKLLPTHVEEVEKEETFTLEPLEDERGGWSTSILMPWMQTGFTGVGQVPSIGERVQKPTLPRWQHRAAWLLAFQWVVT
jgi:hypothetical protein